mmetsp:Transcript_32172/g.78169  ORF Transcript_32172/g.78169 Transcript_32172/m.78169 type:complete len:294 (-) Transcript_32172:104-985(-)
MVQVVIPDWFVSGDDLAAVAPDAFQKHIKYMEDHCICQRMPQDDGDDDDDTSSLAKINNNNNGLLELETTEEEAYRLALADVHQDEDDNEEAKDDDWASQIRSINYTMHDTTTTTTSAPRPIMEQQDTHSISGIITSCSEATAEATNVAKEKTREAISKSQERMEQVHEKLSTRARSSRPLQVVPAWIITGDDVAQMAPESCQSHIRYMEDNCICQRMPDGDEEKTNTSDEDDNDMILDLGAACVSATSATQEKARLFLLKLNARAPLEPPNPKKPGESHFIEEDMMELLETV